MTLLATSILSIKFLISLLILAVVIFVIIKIFQMLGVPEPIRSIIIVIVALILFFIFLDQMGIYNF